MEDQKFKEVVLNSPEFETPEFNHESFTTSEYESSPRVLERRMATIKEMFAPPAENNLLCFAFPKDEPECEIKLSPIHALPTFTGYRERTSVNSGVTPR